MKTRLKLATIGAAIGLVATLGLAAPAQAGNGKGYICNSGWSVQHAYGNLDYLGRGAWHSIAPGSCRGGAGFDLDAVYIPGGRRTTVHFYGLGDVSWNRCGTGGVWAKVSDFGARITISGC